MNVFNFCSTSPTRGRLDEDITQDVERDAPDLINRLAISPHCFLIRLPPRGSHNMAHHPISHHRLLLLLLLLHQLPSPRASLAPDPYADIESSPATSSSSSSPTSSAAASAWSSFRPFKTDSLSSLSLDDIDAGRVGARSRAGQPKQVSVAVDMDDQSAAKIIADAEAKARNQAGLRSGDMDFADGQPSTPSSETKTKSKSKSESESRSQRTSTSDTGGASGDAHASAHARAFLLANEGGDSDHSAAEEHRGLRGRFSGDTANSEVGTRKQRASEQGGHADASEKAAFLAANKDADVGAAAASALPSFHTVENNEGISALGAQGGGGDDASDTSADSIVEAARARAMKKNGLSSGRIDWDM